MNITPNSLGTNFRGAYIDQEGAKKFCNTPYNREIIDDLVETAKMANKSEDNDLILDENGTIYLRNNKYGKFKTDNPPDADYARNNFMCNIIKENGERDRLKITLPTTEYAKAMDKAFGAGTSVPLGRLKLFQAMEAASKYEKELEAQRQANIENAINILTNLNQE